METDTGLSYTHTLKIANNVQVLKRVRFSFWDAIAYIGGVYLGLKLLVGLLMGPLQATFFQNEMVEGLRRDIMLTAK